jgi:hypothetical protein
MKVKANDADSNKEDSEFLSSSGSDSEDQELRIAAA